MSDTPDDKIVEFKAAREKAARSALDGRVALNDLKAMRGQMKTIAPGGPFLEMKPGEWEPDELGLPPHCPVQPLGGNGNINYLLNARGVITELKAGTQQKSEIEIAFGQYLRYLDWAWPRVGKAGPEPDNFDAHKCFRHFNAACSILMARNGPWDEAKMLRGRGVWKRPDGSLVVHLGDRLLLPATGDMVEPGVFDDYLYAMKPCLLVPSKIVPQGDDHGPGARLLEALSTFHWARGSLDAYLALGWLGQSYLSGALNWRSVCWLIGGAGTGKSTLETLFMRLIGEGKKKPTSNATAASIYRGLSGDARAVILDEQEGGKDDRKSRAMVELSREAASGALVERAGGKNNAVESFPVTASFMFAAVSPPGMESADYTRMAMLELRQREDGAEPMHPDWFDREFCEEMGAQLFARMISDFDKVERAIGFYRKALLDVGHTERGADTFSSLLGCAHVMICDDEPDAADAKEWADPLEPSSLAELEFASANWQDCWSQILHAQPRAFQNLSDKTVAAQLNRYRSGQFHTQDLVGELKELRGRLNSVGLGLIHQNRSLQYRDALLFVPALCPAVEQLTAGTQYAGRGKVVSSLRQMPNSYIAMNRVGRIDGVKMKGIGIRLEMALPENTQGDDDADND